MAVATVVFANDTVSRRHAMLRREGDHFIVVDLGSTNGTRVNGRIAGRAEVRPGDSVELGEVQLRL